MMQVNMIGRSCCCASSNVTVRMMNSLEGLCVLFFHVCSDGDTLSSIDED